MTFSQLRDSIAAGPLPLLDDSEQLPTTTPSHPIGPVPMDAWPSGENAIPTAASGRRQAGMTVSTVVERLAELAKTKDAKVRCSG